MYYFTVGYNNSYVDCLKLSIESLKRVSSETIVVLIDESITVELPDDIIVYKCPNSRTPEEASMRKLDILDYVGSTYDTLVFIDCDIIIDCDIDSIVSNIIKNNILYVYSETKDFESHKSIYWSLNDYTSEDLNRLESSGTFVFNAGLFGFRYSNMIKYDFDNIRSMIFNHKGDFFYEQSFMNKYFNNKITDRTVFTDENYKMFPEDNKSYKGKIVHFCGGPGNGNVKFIRMKKYLNI